jgi:hypothetical protein
MHQDTKALYRNVEALSGKTSQKLPISDVNGKALKTQEEQAKRWKEPIIKILNCPDPTVIHDCSRDIINTLDMNNEAVALREVTLTIKG